MISFKKSFFFIVLSINLFGNLLISQTKPYITYWDNGQTRVKGQIDNNDKFVGELYSYYPSGELQSVVNYKFGKKMVLKNDFL